MLTRASLILLLFISLTVNAIDSDTISHPSVGFQVSYGYVPFTGFHVSYLPICPYGVDLSLNKFHTSFKKWKVFHTYWTSGIQAGYLNFQNPSVLGSAYTLMLFAEPVIAHGDKWFFTLRPGMGIAYLTKIYDETENPTNQFFCTHLAFPLSVTARFKYRVGRQTYITVAGAYNHISNGGSKQPNYGMNFLTGYAGVEYFYKTMPSLDHHYSYKLPVSDKKIRFRIQTFGAVTTIPATDTYPEEKPFNLGFNFGVMKRLTHIYSLSAGTELLFDGYAKHMAEREGSDADYKKLSVDVGQAFIFGNVIFAQSLGVYLYSPYKPAMPYYQKYELGYIFKPGIIVGLHLKAYLGAADYSGLSVSWVTGWNKKS